MAQRELPRQDKTNAATVRIRTSLVSLKAVSRPKALAYLAGLIISEAVTVWGSPLAGAVLFAALLVLLLTEAYKAAHTYQRLFYSSIALAPLIRLLSLVLPLQNLPQVAWYPLVALPLLLAVVLVARLNRVTTGMLGLTLRGLPLQLLIGMTGLVLGLVQYLILRPPPLLEETGWIILFVWPLMVLLLVFSAFLEEFIFRGLVQYSALRSLGWFGILFSSALYASLFLGYFSLLNLFFVFFVSLLFGGLALRTGSIMGVSISHALINILVFLFFPYLAVLPFFRSGMAGGAPLPDMTPMPALASPTTLPTSPVLTPTLCPAPIGWVPYLVEPGDSLESLNQGYGTTMEAFLRANCLAEVVPLQVGQRLNVPPATPQPDSLLSPGSLSPGVSPTASPTSTLAPSATSPPTNTPEPPEPTEPPPPSPTFPPPVPPQPSPTREPTEPPPPSPTSPPPSPTPTLRPTDLPQPTDTAPPPTPTLRPTDLPQPTDTAPPPTPALTPTSAPTEEPPTQQPTPTSAPTEEPRPTRRPTRTPRPAQAIIEVEFLVI